MIYADVCAGISAATLAWHPLGWRCAFYSEIDKFPCAVLKHHYPDIPNHGDMRDHDNWPDTAIDVLVGGTPCQGFSIAGLRQGLDDSRSNLALQFALVAKRYKPRWIIWENVPGVRSQNGGRDFGTFVGGLVELGYGCVWRSTDAQYAGLAQRRERLFLVGHLGDWRPAAAVLFEPEGLRWDTAPRREKGQGIAPTIESGANDSGGTRPPGTTVDTADSLIPATHPTLSPGHHGGGGHGYRQRGNEDAVIPVVANPLTYRMHKGVNTTMDEGQTMIAQPLLAKHNDSHRADMETYVSHALRADGFDASEDGTGRGTPIIAFDTYNQTVTGDQTQTLCGRDDDGGNRHLVPAIVFAASDYESGAFEECTEARPLTTSADRTRAAPIVATAFQTRGSNVSAGGDVAGTFGSNADRASGSAPMAFQTSQSGVRAVDSHPTLDSNNGNRRHNGVVSDWAVRRLTPRECERLMGMPDDYTRIAWRGKPAEACPDGPRYKALGDSIAVPELVWIARRIMLCEGVLTSLA